MGTASDMKTRELGCRERVSIQTKYWKKESEVSQSCPTLCDRWTVAHIAPPSMGFSRQEYWSRLPFPSPASLPNPGIAPRSPTLQADSLPTELSGKPCSEISQQRKKYSVLPLVCESSYMNALHTLKCSLNKQQALRLQRFYPSYKGWTSGLSAPLQYENS